MSHPILYTFRRCPYAMRARLMLYKTQTDVEIREVALKNKPQDMLRLSPKGTVPVLLLPEGEVLEESRDIMNWASKKTRSNHGQTSFQPQKPEQELAESVEMKTLIDKNDSTFKYWLDRYKYADRFPEHNAQYYRKEAEFFLRKLEQKLAVNKFLFGNQETYADIAIFPFIRQFAMVDKNWFDNSPYDQIKNWLYTWLDTTVFHSIMNKYKPWQPNDEPIYLLRGSATP